MTVLATPSDVVNRLGRPLTDVEAQRVDALLQDASAAVRTYTGQQFTEGTTTVTLTPERGVVTLAQRPVTDVTTITDTDANDVTFTWYSGGTVYLYPSGADVRLDLNAASPPVRPVTVTYDHGYAAASIPDDIVAVVCGVTLRALGRTPLESGVMQQSIAGYSETIGPVGAAGPVGFLAEEKQILDKYRRPVGRVLAGW